MTPVIRDLDGYTYFRENDSRLLAGGFEPVAKPAFEDGVIPGVRPNFIILDIKLVAITLLELYCRFMPGVQCFCNVAIIMLHRKIHFRGHGRAFLAGGLGSLSYPTGANVA